MFGSSMRPLSRRTFLAASGAVTATGLAGAAIATPESVAAGLEENARTSWRTTMPFVEVEPGVRLFVQDWGSGKPIVFVHGWPSNHRIVEYQLLPLANRGFRTVGVALRGFGRSD